MTDPTLKRPAQGTFEAFRVLIFGLIVVIVILGLALVIMTMSTGKEPIERERVNALFNSRDTCVTCHRRDSPGIVEQYAYSTMALAEVTCRDCHEVIANYPGAVEHDNTWVLISPTPAICQNCHGIEVREFTASRHATPAYAAIRGTEDFTPEQLADYEAIPEGHFSPDKERNALYTLEGEAVTRFACHGCHDIGAPQPDGSVGQCQSCHLRHEFSLEQVRKPETCNACHIGPDHPQWEIYQESPHGIAYMTGGDRHNWDAEVGTLTVSDFPAPNCATCHISGFGASGTTHDVGDRLTWFLFSSISERRPAWQDNRLRMQRVCQECHNSEFIDAFYNDADALVVAVNDWVLESQDIIQPLKDNNLLTGEAFDEPIDFVIFDLWHHWGRTAKFGAWMQGPDYTQWHGAYELLRELAELKVMVDEKLEDAGVTSEPGEPEQPGED